MRQLLLMPFIFLVAAQLHLVNLASAENTCGVADGICPSGCTFYEDADCPKCDSEVGLTAPVRICSAQFPCTNLLETYTAQGITEISSPTDTPLCRTRTISATPGATGCINGGRGNYNDGAPLSWVDADSTNRYWCEFRPSGTSSSSRRPLLIYVPGSGGSADDAYDRTLLRTKAINYDLTGDAGRAGFILVTVQGRNLHWPTGDPQDGSKHDSYHRDLNTNRDVAFFDHLIDSLVAEGVADPERIYITGWSNGGRFAAFYGVSRHAMPTPGGNRIAAVAPYSGGDPFENIADAQTPSCKANVYPATTLPYFLISRNCDAVACNQTQYDFFNAQGWIMTPGNQAEGWISNLQAAMSNPNTEWLLIGYYGTGVSSCLATPAPCTTSMAIRNHFCWPDGISDSSGIDHEPDLLDFLRSNRCYTYSVSAATGHSDNIQSVYNIVISGETIRLVAQHFFENLDLTRDIEVLLRGGYGCNYSANPGMSIINGSITIRGGTATISNMIIR